MDENNNPQNAPQHLSTVYHMLDNGLLPSVAFVRYTVNYDSQILSSLNGLHMLPFSLTKNMSYCGSFFVILGQAL